MNVGRGVVRRKGKLWYEKEWKRERERERERKKER